MDWDQFLQLAYIIYPTSRLDLMSLLEEFLLEGSNYKICMEYMTAKRTCCMVYSQWSTQSTRSDTTSNFDIGQCNLNCKPLVCLMRQDAIGKLASVSDMQNVQSILFYCAFQSLWLKKHDMPIAKTFSSFTISNHNYYVYLFFVTYVQCKCRFILLYSWSCFREGCAKKASNGDAFHWTPYFSTRWELFYTECVYHLTLPPEGTWPAPTKQVTRHNVFNYTCTV